MAAHPARRRRKTQPGLPQILLAVAAVIVVGGGGIWLMKGLTTRKSSSVPATADKQQVKSPQELPKSAAPKRRGNTTVAAGVSTTPADRDAGTEPSAATPSQSAAGGKQGGKQSQPAAAVGLIKCQIQTTEPGFLVLVDGILARDDRGRPLETPCEVAVVPGTRTFHLAREKYTDVVRDVPVIDGEELEFSPVYDPFGTPQGYFASRFTQTPVGGRVELVELNDQGSGWDPWLSADGLSLYFAGERPEGRGLFVATRTRVLDDFTTAQRLQRTSEAPLSPTLTADGLTLAYSLQGRSQVRSLVRDDTTDPFQPGPPLSFRERDQESWPLAAISADGLTLYCLSERAGQREIIQVSRPQRDKEFGSSWKRSSLPGGEPRFSADGTRLYWLADHQLMRARRISGTTGFEEPSPVCRLPQGGFARKAGQRQWVISDDETWLWGSDGPAGKETLFAWRLQDVPTHGAAVRGRSIPRKQPREPAAEAAASHSETPADKPRADSPADRPALLPYAAFRKSLEERLARYDIPAAEELLNRSRELPELLASQELLAWDAADLARVRSFWDRFQTTLASLQPGDSLRIKGKAVEFVRYADGVVAAKNAAGAEARYELADLTPVEVVMLVDRKLDRQDKDAQVEAGIFLALTGKAPPANIAARLQRGGPPGRQFVERQLLRKLHLLRDEAARGKFARAQALADEIIAAAPRTDVAREAQAERDSFAARLAWKPVGRQTWEQAQPDEHGTTAARSPGSYLQSGNQYGNFRLTLDWKTVGETAQGGVYFRYPGSGELRKAAWKIQLANDAAQGTVDRFSTGALFGERAPKSNRAKPAGEWNSLDLRVDGDQVQVTVNGELVLEGPLGDPNMADKGVICLDGEFGGIVYRNVVVYELEGVVESGR